MLPTQGMCLTVPVVMPERAEGKQERDQQARAPNEPEAGRRRQYHALAGALQRCNQRSPSDVAFAVAPRAGLYSQPTQPL